MKHNKKALHVRCEHEMDVRIYTARTQNSHRLDCRTRKTSRQLEFSPFCPANRRITVFRCAVCWVNSACRCANRSCNSCPCCGGAMLDGTEIISAEQEDRAVNEHFARMDLEEILKETM